MSIRSDITFIRMQKKRRIFKSLKEITKYGILFSTEQNNYIKADYADHAGNTDTRKSITGFKLLKLGVVQLFGDQQTVVVSITKAK